MTTAKTKAPTRKVFHFPKGDTMQADQLPQEAVKPAARSKSKPAAPKAAPKKAVASKKTTPVAAADAAVPAKAAKPAKAVKPPKAAKPEKVAAPKKTPAAKPVKAEKATAGKKVAAVSESTPAVDKKKAPKVEKVVRDSFTMPKSDYAKIAALKQKCLEEGVHVKKSELLRAGLLMLEAATVKRLVAAIGELETVKTGRPAGV